MKTTVELPDRLMRAVRVRAAQTDRSMKDVVVEALVAALARDGATSPGSPRASAKSHAPKLDPALEALFAEGDAMAGAQVDFQAWNAHSRDVWR